MLLSVHHFHPNTHPENCVNIDSMKRSIFDKDNHPLLDTLDQGGEVSQWEFMGAASVLAAEKNWREEAEAAVIEVCKGEIDVQRFLDFQVFDVLFVGDRKVAEANRVWNRYFGEEFIRLPDFHSKRFICRCKGRSLRLKFNFHLVLTLHLKERLILKQMFAPIAVG